MLKGRVKWTNKDKGWGFLTVDHVEGDVFFHHTSTQGKKFANLEEGDAVECTIKITDRGLHASTVKVV